MIKYRNSPWFIALVSIFVAFLLSPDLWIYLIQGYEGDSFYTLGATERFGLIGLTIVLSGTLLILGTCKSHFLYNSSYSCTFSKVIPSPKISIPLLDLIASFVLIYLFIWLSPQAYYSYYLIIFNDLPLQIVIKEGPGFNELGNLILMTDQSTLSQNGQGLLGRSLLLQVILYRFVLFIDVKNNQ